MIRTLKGRISLIYFILVVISALIGMTAAFNLFRLSNSINGLMTANYKSIKAINNMQDAIEKQNYAILLYLRVYQKQGIDSFIKNQNLFLHSYRIENNNITEPDEGDLVTLLHQEYMQFLNLFAELQAIKNKEGNDRANSFNNTVIRPKVMKVELLLQELATLNEQAMFRSKDKANFNAEKSMGIMLVISLFAVLGGFGAAGLFINRFFRPINKLTETMKLVKAGDLNQEAPIVYQDEIGELALEFNNMTKRLLQYEESSIGKLMTEKNKFVAIVKNISDPIIVLDRHFRITLINDSGETVFGVDEIEVFNKHILEVIKHEALFDHIEGIFDTSDEYREKVILINSKDTDYYFNVIVKAIKEFDATITNVVILFQNITQFKQLEKVKTDFIATVSHEFKTPLTSLTMGLSLLLEQKIGALNEKQLTTISTMAEDGKSLVGLVNDLLEMAKIESDKSIFKIGPVAIFGVIENTLKNFWGRANLQEVNLINAADDELPKVSADPEKIQWVLNNLIGNALKYTNAGDEILVTVKVKQDKMYVSVEDTGAGIPPQYLDKLFDKFVQVKGYDLEVRGTGLGLAIAREIVEAHGGEIWCESSLDAGSTFTFTLPLSKGV